jgi:hypothetical protein
MQIRKTMLCVGLCCAITGALYAQKIITDTREFGSWVYADSGFRGASHFDTTKSNIPKTLVPWTQSPLTFQNMQTILSVFKDACPKPQYLSHTFGVATRESLIPTTKRFTYDLHIGEGYFIYDKAGKVKPMSSGEQFADMYEGVSNISVNVFPEPTGSDGISRKGIKSAFAYANKLTYKDTQLTPRSTGPVYLIPPQNNFAKEARDWKENIPDTMRLSNLPAEYFRLQQIRIQNNPVMSGGSIEKTNYGITNLIFLSKNNKLPFVPLTRERFLGLLDTMKDEEIAFQKKSVMASSDYQKKKDYYDKMLNEIIKPLEAEKQAVQTARDFFKDSLQSPAIIHQDHIGIVEGYLWLYTSKADKSQRQNITEIFEKDANLGTSLVQFQKGFYDGLKDGEVRSLIIEWGENYRPAQNKDHGKLKPKGEPTTNSDAPGNIRHALRHNFNWSRLTNLVK